MDKLRTLYLNQLLDVYDAEMQQIDALSDMVSAASSVHLQQTFSNHLDQTRQHVQRLAVIFTDLDIVPGNETCEEMRDLLKESEQLTHKLTLGSDEKDADLIAAARQVELYEIEAYLTLCRTADMLSETAAAEKLKTSLEEEKNMIRVLSELAESNQTHEKSGL